MVLFLNSSRASTILRVTQGSASTCSGPAFVVTVRASIVRTTVTFGRSSVRKMSIDVARLDDSGMSWLPATRKTGSGPDQAADAMGELTLMGRGRVARLVDVPGQHHQVDVVGDSPIDRLVEGLARNPPDGWTGRRPGCSSVVLHADVDVGGVKQLDRHSSFPENLVVGARPARPASTRPAPAVPRPTTPDLS